MQRHPAHHQVCSGALDLVDLGGVEQLTATALASKLGCRREEITDIADSPSALIDLACDQVYREVETDPAGQSWAERLRGYSHSYRKALLHHPRIVPHLAMRPIVHDSGLTIAEHILSELTTVGFSPEEANRVLIMIVGFVNGHALRQIGVDMREPEKTEAIARARQAVPADRIPILSHVFAIDNDRDAEFELGIDLVVSGLERNLLHAAPR